MRHVRNVLQITIYLLLISRISVAQWTQIYNGLEPKAIIANGKYVFAAANEGTIMLRSSNGGTNWDTVNTGLTNSPGFTDVECLAANGINVFAGVYGAGVFLSSDNGASWAAADTALTVPDPHWLIARDTHLFAGANNGLFESSDNGMTWIPIDTVLWKNRGVFSLFFLNDSMVFAGTDSGLFRSTNGGTDWTESDSGIPIDTLPRVGLVAMTQSTLFARAGSFMFQEPWGLYASTNNGASWGLVGKAGLPDSASFGSFLVTGTNLFAGGDGINLSTDGGLKWNAVGAALSGVWVEDLAVDSENLYAVTEESGTSLSWTIWRRPLSQMITSVTNAMKTLPENFALNQNYPNPFNPSTLISYQLPSNAYVTLKVFDVLGRHVQTLVNELQRGGIHSVRFNAAKLPSGVYFYRLEAGAYHDTKKLLLLK